MPLTRATYAMVDGAAVNILDYGAVGDYDENTGIGADSTAAIQAAVNAAASSAINPFSRGAVCIPAGSYKITGTIQVPYGISIYGEGATASTIHCLDCDGINFTTFGYAFGNMFFQDFGLTAASGTNRKAIVTATNASTMDGLYFQRLRLYGWDVGFSLGSNWSSEISQCVVGPVNIAVDISPNNGEVVKLNIKDNFFTYTPSGGGARGNSNRYAIWCRNTSKFTEAIHIHTNSMFGFTRCISLDQALYVTIFDNDLSSQGGPCIVFDTANGGYFIQDNYIETNNVGVLANPTNVADLARFCLIQGNKFIGLTGATNGVQIGTSDSSTHGGSINVLDNQFQQFSSHDIRGYQLENVRISNNVCTSSAPTNSINVSTAQSVNGSASLISDNYCIKPIYVDPTAYTAGYVRLVNNAENGVFRAWQQSAAPTTGTWRVGDIVWNNAPASGQPPGWMCTVAGTPGTWKAMANLA
jgi:hypothetical protein